MPRMMRAGPTAPLPGGPSCRGAPGAAVAVAVASLVLVAITCIDVLNLGQTFVWLDLSRAPHLAAVDGGPDTPPVDHADGPSPLHHPAVPPPLLLFVLVAVGLVVLPRGRDPAARPSLAIRLRGPPVRRSPHARP